jgi:gamma-glutamyltranspeptidase/glutathione hydrolase
MKMIAYDLSKMGHNSPEAIQIIVEAERRAYADRNFFLGDPDYVKMPLKQLMDDTYLKTEWLVWTLIKLPFRRILKKEK